MKIHYRTGNQYTVDLNNFDLAEPLKAYNVYKYDYVKKLNDEWLKVISYLDQNFEFDMGEDLEQYFTIPRLDNEGLTTIYDFGFHIPKIQEYIHNNPQKTYDMFPQAFGTDPNTPINYTHYDKPEFFTDGPIIITDDFITSRAVIYQEGNELPPCIVIDGNNRVSHVKNSQNMGIKCRYISLKEMIENDFFLSELDKAIYCHTADIVFLQRNIENPNLKHVSRKYYKKSYLNKYFRKYINKERKL